MESRQFLIFSKFRDEFKNYCAEFNSAFQSELRPLQISAAKKDTPPYPVENPVVYNTALDSITQDSQIKKIVIGDNPGKNEQLSCNKKYLVGQAGKIAQSFFQNHPEFETDFRENVIILNKTPVHSAKTAHLKQIEKEASAELAQKIRESEIWLAEKTAELHQNLCRLSPDKNSLPELWLVGYGELRQNGIFAAYRETLKKSYLENQKADARLYWDKVFVFQHFSMNRFSIDLKNFAAKENTGNFAEGARKLGALHKIEIFQ